jgi:hypothetical protein
MNRSIARSTDATQGATDRPSRPAQVGAVAPASGSTRDELERWLAQHGIAEAEWFAPGDLHDLDRAVRRGRIGHVVFPDAADLLAGIWEEEIVFEEWQTTGVRVEFANVQGSVSTATTPTPASGLVQINEVVRNWQSWRQRHRRRQAITGAVVSAAVLAISFILCVLLAR